jgi:hypothetical protein
MEFNGLNGMDIYTFITVTVFPLINDWREQYKDRTRSDHSEAGRNFLWGTLPYLALVAFQDGIYWIKDFPQHEASRLLLNIMPPWYPQYAAHARREIENKQHDVEAVQISVMNNAVQAAFNLVTVRLDDVNHSMVALDRKVETAVAELQQHSAATTAAAAATTAAATAAARPGYPRANFQPPLPPPPQMQRRVGQQQPGAAERQQQPPIWNVNDRLRAVPLVPAFPAALPATMTRLLQEHFDHNLNQFETARKQGWTNAIRGAYSKRMYLYNQIKIQAARYRSEEDFLRVKMPRAAADLDKRRPSGQTLPKFMQALKDQDPTTTTRKRNRD